MDYSYYSKYRTTCGEECPQGKKRKGIFKSISPSSPLGGILNSWDSNEVVKDLDKIKMIKYCREVWPKKRIAEGLVYWPWYGAREKWLCVALKRYVNIQGQPCDEEISYAKCWLGKEKQDEEVKVYKVSREKDKEEARLAERR